MKSSRSSVEDTLRMRDISGYMRLKDGDGKEETERKRIKRGREKERGTDSPLRLLFTLVPCSTFRVPLSVQFSRSREEGGTLLGSLSCKSWTRKVQGQKRSRFSILVKKEEDPRRRRRLSSFFLRDFRVRAG